MTAVSGSSTSTSRTSFQTWVLEKPEVGSRPTFAVKARSAVVIGTPSPHFRPGRSFTVTAMPCVPLAPGSMRTMPFSSVGSSVQSMQVFCQPLSNAVISRRAKSST